jgi:hypothetical protein
VFLLFGQHPFIYMHMFVFALVECETVCSQYCALG